MNVLGLYPVPTSDGVGGYEGVGEIMATGPNVTRLKKGDRVVPLGARTGTWRDYVVSDEASWYVVSPGLSLADAATLVVNPVSALLMLEQIVDLKEGDVVVQNGANSEVGKYVICLAAKRGIKTINIVRDRPDLKDVVSLLKGLGATLVTTPERVETDAKEAGLEPILGFNCVGGTVATTMANMMKTSGTLVTYGAMTNDFISVGAAPFIFKDLRLRGFWLGTAIKSKEEQQQLLDRAQELIKSKHISSDCTEIPLEDWKKAFDKGPKKAMLVMNK